MKRPWFSFYASDWLTDSRTRRMTAEERGFYIDLLSFSWIEGGIPDVMIRERAALARICGVTTRRFVVLWESIRDRFEEDSTGFHFNPRLERERERADKFSELQSNKAKQKNLKTAAAKAPAHASDKTIQDSTRQEEQKKPAADKPPLPFSVDQALGFLAEGGRFTATPADSGQSINLTKLIRKHPDPVDWRLVGQWLAAGGEGFRDALDTRAAGDFKHWLPHARKWEAGGRPPVRAKNGQQSLGYRAPMPAAKENREVKLE